MRQHSTPKPKYFNQMTMNEYGPVTFKSKKEIPNYDKIHDVLRESTPLDSHEIALKTGLTYPTVASLLSQLKRLGVVKVASHSQVPIGRSRNLWTLCH